MASRHLSELFGLGSPDGPGDTPNPTPPDSTGSVTTNPKFRKPLGQLLQLLGTTHPLCPSCGGGYAGVSYVGDLVCFNCNPSAYPDKGVAFRVMLRQPDPAKAEGIIEKYPRPDRSKERPGLNQAASDGHPLTWEEEIVADKAKLASRPRCGLLLGKPFKLFVR